jgi:hypothetical protein
MPYTKQQRLIHRTWPALAFRPHVDPYPHQKPIVPCSTCDAQEREFIVALPSVQPVRVWPSEVRGV